MSLPLPKLLVVDDVPENLTILLRILEHQGFQVVLAEDGKHGLKLAQTEQPELILLDVMMPGMDGFEVCKRLKQHDATRDIPVLFMSAMAEAEDRVRGFLLGAADYVSKPYEPREMLARVRYHLRQHRLIREGQQQRQALAGRLEQLEQLCAGLKSEALNLAQSLPHAESTELASLTLALHSILEALPPPALLPPERLLPLEMESILERVRARLRRLNPAAEFKTLTPWPPCQGYAPWVETVWLSYLYHAAKHAEPGFILEVGANLLPDASAVRCWVRDHGGGPGYSAYVKLLQSSSPNSADPLPDLASLAPLVAQWGGRMGAEVRFHRGCDLYFTLPRP